MFTYIYFIFHYVVWKIIYIVYLSVCNTCSQSSQPRFIHTSGIWLHIPVMSTCIWLIWSKIPCMNAIIPAQKIFVRFMKDTMVLTYIKSLKWEKYNAFKTPAYPMAINQAELNASRQFRWHKQYGKTLCFQSMQSASVWKFFWIWNREPFWPVNRQSPFNIL